MTIVLTELDIQRIVMAHFNAKGFKVTEQDIEVLIDDVNQIEQENVVVQVNVDELPTMSPGGYVEKPAKNGTGTQIPGCWISHPVK